MLRKEEELKNKAREHEAKLLAFKDQKLSVFRQQMKQELTDTVQGKYENFKVLLDAYMLEQLDSLKLEKDMKINEIDELSDRIKNTIQTLHKNL